MPHFGFSERRVHQGLALTAVGKEQHTKCFLPHLPSSAKLAPAASGLCAREAARDERGAAFN